MKIFFALLHTSASMTDRDIYFVACRGLIAARAVFARDDRGVVAPVLDARVVLFCSKGTPEPPSSLPNAFRIIVIGCIGVS